RHEVVHDGGTDGPVLAQAQEAAVEILAIVAFGRTLHAGRVAFYRGAIGKDEGSKSPVIGGELVVHFHAPVVVVLHGADQGREVIVGEQVREERRRNQRRDLARYRADAGGRHDLVRKRIASETPSTVRSRGSGIIDRRRPSREIAAQKVRRGNGDQRLGGSLPAAEALDGSEEERAVLSDRSADGASELVLSGGRFDAREKTSRVKFFVAEEFKRAAMKFVGAALEGEARHTVERVPVFR